jgi:hypothetical protein
MLIILKKVNGDVATHSSQFVVVKMKNKNVVKDIIRKLRKEYNKDKQKFFVNIIAQVGYFCLWTLPLIVLLVNEETVYQIPYILGIGILSLLIAKVYAVIKKGNSPGETILGDIIILLFFNILFQLFRVPFILLKSLIERSTEFITPIGVDFNNDLLSLNIMFATLSLISLYILLLYKYYAELNKTVDSLNEVRIPNNQK